MRNIRICLRGAQGEIVNVVQAPGVLDSINIPTRVDGVMVHRKFYRTKEALPYGTMDGPVTLMTVYQEK